MSTSKAKRKSASASAKISTKPDDKSTQSSKKPRTTDDQLSSTNKNALKHLTVLEDGHVDFVYRDADEDEEATIKKKNKKTVERRIYLILMPRGTADQASKRRLIFTKTRIEEDGPHQVQIENMANTGSSSEASITNKDSVRFVGQVAVGNYSILYDTESRKTHFVYILTNGKLMTDKNGQKSFTIEIQDHEEYEKEVLQKFRENLWLYVHPERMFFDSGIQMIFTQNSEELAKQHAQLISSPSISDLNEYEKLWKTVNDHFKDHSKFQNLSVPGVSEHDLKQAEKRLGGILLPDDIKHALRIHNGRSKFGYGLHYRSPTTDLLPLNEWHPYESEGWCNDLFEQAVQGDVPESMKEDVKEHLKLYDGKEENIKKKNFKELQTELLVIGEGMDDYCEQYLLGLRTGTIYLQILNLPEWTKIGTFKDWVDKALESTFDSEDDDD